MSVGRIVLASNTSWNIVNFRANLVRLLIRDGYEVVVVAPYDERHAGEIRDLGCEYVPMPMDNKGANPFRDFCLFLAFWRLLRKIRPDCFLAFTIKPNVYGGLASHWMGIPVVNNVAGLGTVFIKRSWITPIAMWLYKIALQRSQKVFFQNDDDLKLFLAAKLVRDGQVEVLPGSGVDTKYFVPQCDRNRSQSRFQFLLIARLLWDKGVGEYVEAARLLLEKYPSTQFSVLGFLDVANRTAVSRQDIADWTSAGLIHYFGSATDVRPYIAAADCVVLPSYREGTSRSLLEAASMAKPIIATDVAGCRQVVEHEVNGYLVKVRDSKDLAEKMERMLLAGHDHRKEMGVRGREKMIHEYDEQLVLNRYRRAVEILTLR